MAQATRAWLNTGGLLYFAWVIPAALLLVVFAVLYFSFLVDLPARTRRLFLIAGGVYVGGALGLEILGSYMATRFGRESIPYEAAVVVEEFCEMVGVVIFL